MGVRLALGATGPGIFRMVVRQGMLLVVSGLVVGVPLGAVALKTLRAVAFGVEPAGPAVFIAAVLLLGLSGFCACAAPAWRAAMAEPSTCLRAE